MSRKRYGDIEYRAGRYVMDVHLRGQGFVVAQKTTKLPTILASAINQVIFTKDRQLRIELGKLKQYLNYCIESYRAYYRGRNNQLAES
jgi:hypothetical protein